MNSLLPIPGLKALEIIINDAIISAYKVVGKKIDEKARILDLTKKFRDSYLEYIDYNTRYATLIGHHKPVKITDIFVEFLLDTEPKDDWKMRELVTEPIEREILFSKLKTVSSLSIRDGHILIVGPPGAGKSTLSKYFCQYACGKVDTPIEYVKNRFLFYIPVKDLSDNIPQGILDDSKKYIVYLMEQIISGLDFKYPQELVYRLLSKGQCCIIIDGVDECNEHIKSMLFEGLKHIAAVHRENNLLVFSRPRAVPDGLYGFSTYSVLGFDSNRWKKFIRNWYKNKAKGEELIQLIENDVHLQDISGNPLLVSILCILYERNFPIPKKKSDIYNRCIDALMYELDRAKGYRRTYSYQYINEQKRKDIFSLIAFNMQMRHTLFTSSRRITEYLSAAKYLKDLIDNEELGKLLYSLELEHGILVEWSKDTFIFPHRTFQEFLAAWHVERSRKELWLVKALRDELKHDLEWWSEVLIILSHLLFDATEFVESLMYYSYEFEFKRRLIPEILIQDISCNSSVFDYAKDKGYIR